MMLSSVRFSLLGLAAVSSVAAYGFISDDEPSKNLIPNGDFSQGNTGFKSALAYTEPADNCLWPAAYTVTKLFNNPQLHKLIVHEAFMAPKRPSGKENVLFANAGGTEPLTVWETDVKVQPKTTYKLSFYSISFSGVQDEGTPPRQIFTPEWVPQFEFHVNKDVSSEYSAGMGKYFKANMTWYSGNAKTANIKIVRTKMEHHGGIIGIANIEMVPVKPSDKPATASE